MANESQWDPQAPPIVTIPLKEALQRAPSLALGSYRLTALGLGNQPDAATLSALRLEQGSGVLTIRASRPLRSVALYLSYDARLEHWATADAEHPNVLSLINAVEPGLVAIGLAGIGESEIDPAVPLATVYFEPGAEPGNRLASAISQAEATAVRDLTAVYDGTGTATLGWHERHKGDYNIDGEVNISDLTPMGVWFKATVDEADPDWAKMEIVDGNEDGEITINDVTEIGANFGSFLYGYNVYRMALATIDDTPAPSDPGWVKVENAADPSGPTAPREGMYTGQLTRLLWTLIDSPAAGMYAWYVAPAGRPGETPLEGLPSNVAKQGEGPLPLAQLDFEIQAPASDTLAVGQEFYIGVNVSGAEDLFSANVRFEYDSTLVEYVDAIALYSDSSEHTNLLHDPASSQAADRNPLFAGTDAGAAPGGDGYRTVGFNTTKMRGEAPASGPGCLGYVKFRTLVEGSNPSCFRFPQVTTFIYLWGSQYGVATAAPTLGDAQGLSISGGAGVTEHLITWGGDGDDRAYAIAVGTNHVSYIVGNINSFGSSYVSAQLIKVNDDGSVAWAKTWGGGVLDELAACVVDDSGNVYAAGYTADNGAGMHDGLLLKYNSEGVLQWQKAIGGSDEDYLSALALGDDGYLYAAGFERSAGAGDYDSLLCCFSLDGALQWQRIWGGANWDEADAVAIDPSDGSIYLAGNSQSFNTSSAWGEDFLILKYSPAGALLNSLRWDMVDEQDIAEALVIDASGNLYVGGESVTGCVLLKLSSTGTLLWQKTWGPTEQDWIEGLALATSGAVYCVGRAYTSGSGSWEDCALYKVTLDGAISAQTTWQGMDNECASACAVSSDGLLYVAGYGLNNTGTWLTPAASAVDATGIFEPVTGTDIEGTMVVTDLNGDETSPTGVLNTGGGADDFLVVINKTM